MKTLVIDRSKWARGSCNSKLLSSENGKMCCLGFYARFIDNIPKEEIEDCGEPSGCYPASRESKLTVSNPVAICYNSGFTNDAITINDASSISDEEREEKLIELFAKNDVALSFVG